MSHETDLKRIERRAYLTYHQDGIWDLAVGLVLVGVAIAIVSGSEILTMAVPALPVLAVIVVPLVRKAFTLPRLGYVRFSEERRAKEERGKLGLVAIMVLTALLGAVFMAAWSGEANWQRWLRDLGLIPFGGVLSLVALGLGWAYGIKRCFAYAALILATFLVCHALQTRASAQFSVVGTVLCLVGLTLLVRFAAKYPRPAQGEPRGV